MKACKFRDLTLITINPGQMLVIACDSCGGIGNKEKDIIKVSPEIVGYFTAHVALAEVLAVGAKPIAIVNTLSVEMNNTGERIIEGIKRALEPLPLSEQVIITGSTEENFRVFQTAIGVTVIGMLNRGEWKWPRTYKGAIAAVVGLPKVGDEIQIEGDKEVLSIPVLLKLQKNPYVQEILPVGSRGILYELEKMAETNNIFYVLDEVAIDLHKSAGPATCAVVSVDERGYENLKENCSIPVHKIGKFI